MDKREKIRRKKIASSFSKTKTSFLENEKLMKTKLKTPMKKTRNKIISSMTSYKEQTERLSKRLMSNNKELINKNKLILSLGLELDFYKRENYSYRSNKDNTENKKDISKRYVNEIDKFKKTVEEDLKDFVDTLNRYEKKKEELKEERKYLIKAAELLIENKLKEQKILEEKLKNLNQQITQNDIINEKLLSVYKDLNKQVNGENGDFYQNEKEYTFKYFNLLEKYKHLEKLYHYYSNLQEKTERNLIEEDILNRENENNNREIDVRLKDKEIKEEYLKSVVCDIRDKMEQVKEAQEEEFKEKERIRFLGKALHGRLKGLKEINDKIKKKELESKKKKGKI